MVTDDVWYHATCTNPDCGYHGQPVSMPDYEERANWVGRHRIATGHTVQTWTGHFDDRDNPPVT